MKNDPPRVVCRIEVGAYSSRYANPRGDKSAKRVLWGLLSLLAPRYLKALRNTRPHTQHRRDGN